MIRIIAGTYKGRFLKVPDSRATRPTMDKVRQAIFSAVKDAPVGAVVLDLFAGSGAMGIEAYSRGAKEVYLNDKDHGTFQVLRENVQSLSLPPEDVHLSLLDYRIFLKRCRDVVFDLVLLDPPYRFRINAEILRNMEENHQLSACCVLVSEQDYPNPDLPGFEKKEYRYGEKHVAVYRRKGEEEHE